MKRTVVSYSLSGNNDALARAVASELKAMHIRVEEERKRTMGTIVVDMILNRTPKVTSFLDGLESSDLVCFIGPVWMGKIATPLRGVFRRLKGTVKHYAFISICGGADGPNPKLEDELTERMGTRPAAVIELHIADLLPADPKPERKDTMAYQLSENDIHTLSARVLNTLTQSIITEGE